MNNNINKETYINKLQQEKAQMQNEINRLKQGIKRMNDNVNQANLLYSERKKDYEKALILKDNKINENKQKIANLKIKINELYNEINTYKEYKEMYENNKIHILSGKGNNVFRINKNLNNNIKTFEEDRDTNDFNIKDKINENNENKLRNGNN